jgi:hypothetical protein
VTWINDAIEARGFVFLPATTASAFTCSPDLRPYFRKTAAGYLSLPITSAPGADRVRLPCPLGPGTHPYDVWLMGEGPGAIGEEAPERKLSGTIVVE